MFGFDVGGNVGEDGDEVFYLVVVVMGGLYFEVEVKFVVGFGVVGEVGVDVFVVCNGCLDMVEGVWVCVGFDYEVGWVVVGDVGEFVFENVFEVFVDLFDGVVGLGDDDDVVGVGGDEGEFMGGGLVEVEGFFGFFVWGDVL